MRTHKFYVHNLCRIKQTTDDSIVISVYIKNNPVITMQEHGNETGDMQPKTLSSQVLLLR